MASKHYPLHQSPFFKLRSKARLARLLRVPTRELKQLTAGPANYQEWDVVTPKGKVRHIENPNPRLKAVHRRLAKLLSDIAAPEYVQCPVKGRSYISNAKMHAGSSEVRTLDIAEFFRSTTRERVCRFFRTRLQCSPDVAYVLSALTTLSGHLPTGSPVSPILAFFVHAELWESIHALASSIRCAMSIYIDDLTVSGPRVSGDIWWAVKKAIHTSGHRYHKEKRFTGGVACVTGVIVKNGKLFVPNRSHLKRRELREKLAQTIDHESKQQFEQVMRGLQAQARQIESANDSMLDAGSILIH